MQELQRKLAIKDEWPEKLASFASQIEESRQHAIEPHSEDSNDDDRKALEMLQIIERALAEKKWKELRPILKYDTGVNYRNLSQEPRTRMVEKLRQLRTELPPPGTDDKLLSDYVGTLLKRLESN